MSTRTGREYSDRRGSSHTAHSANSTAYPVNRSIGRLCFSTRFNADRSEEWTVDSNGPCTAVGTVNELCAIQICPLLLKWFGDTTGSDKSKQILVRCCAPVGTLCGLYLRLPPSAVALLAVARSVALVVGPPAKG